MFRKSAWVVLAAFFVMAGSASAATTANVTITVTIENLAISIDQTTVDFGVMALSASKVAATAVTVTYDGTVNEDFGLQITTASNPAGWSAGTTLTDVGANKYVLAARKAATTPVVGDYLNTDVLTTSVQMGDGTKFGAFGNNVAPAATNTIYFLMKTMTSVTDPTQHSIVVQVSCQKH